MPFNQRNNPVKPEVTIFEKENYDRVFEEIKSLDFEVLTPKQIQKVILEKFGGQFILVKEILAQQVMPVYRITTHEPSPEERHLPSSFSYNPNPSKMGRANLEDEVVFYGALHPYTCLKEMKDDLRGEYFLSEWEFVPNETFFIAILLADVNTKEDSIASMVAGDLEDVMKKMVPESSDPLLAENFWYGLKIFSRLFTDPSEKFYPITSAISSSWLQDLPKKGGTVGMLMYPSVTSENKEINLAIRKEVADLDEFKLKSVIKFNLHEKPFMDDYTSILEKGFVNKDGFIDWGIPNYEIEHIDLQIFGVSTTCGRKFSSKEKGMALFNLGSEFYRKMKNCKDFIHPLVEKVMKSTYRVGIENKAEWVSGSSPLAFFVVTEMFGTFIKIGEEKHQVKYLKFFVKAR